MEPLPRSRTTALIACALVALAGCARPASAPRAPTGPEYVQLGALEFSALVERDPDGLFATAQIMNADDDATAVEYGGLCGLSLLLFPPAGSGDTAVWDAARLEGGSCSAPSDRFEIPPRTLARVLTPLLQTSLIRGDSLAPGTYRAAVRLRVLQPRDTTLLLPAGTVELF